VGAPDISSGEKNRNIGEIDHRKGGFDGSVGLV